MRSYPSIIPHTASIAGDLYGLKTGPLVTRAPTRSEPLGSRSVGHAPPSYLETKLSADLKVSRDPLKELRFHDSACG